MGIRADKWVIEFCWHANLMSLLLVFLLLLPCLSVTGLAGWLIGSLLVVVVSVVDHLYKRNNWSDMEFKFVLILFYSRRSCCTRN